MNTAMAVQQHPSDSISPRIGMWLFLFTEIIFFGGMFLLYAVFRTKFQADFHFCGSTLDTFLGTLNTMVLLTSSLTMVLAVSETSKNRKGNAISCLVITILLGTVFLFIKYFEWTHKIEMGLFPNSEILLQHPHGENIFYALYFAMTGLHAIHVVIGMIVLGFMIFMLTRSSNSNVKIENSGLYWHLVDLIWIYLFPLFYLIT